MQQFTPSQLDYMRWIKNTMPRFYADRVQPFLSNQGLGSIGADDSSSSTWMDILNSVTDAIPSLGQSYAQYATAQAALQQKTNQMIYTTRASTVTSYMPWLLGGGALLAVLFIATR